MSDLSPDALALLRSGRRAFRPGPSDKERVRLALAGALGEGALQDPSQQPGTAGVGDWARSPAWTGVVLGSAVAIAIGAALLTASHRTAGPSAQAASHLAPSAPPSAPIAAGSAPTPGVEAASPISLDQAAPSAPPEATVSASRRATQLAPAPDPLAEEVRLLSRAERLLNRGEGEAALATLGEHERRFPKGALAEERMAARVEALCALGRIGDAKRERARLASAYPKSIHLSGTGRVCDNGLDDLAP